MGLASRIKVLCADDHPLMRAGIAFAIRTQVDMEVVAEAANGFEAVSAYRKHRPDITLMDLRMPVLSGIAATAAILDEFPQARILILTTSAGDVSASLALKSGALGYLFKGALGTELVDGIRCVHAGKRHVSPQIAKEIASHLSNETLTMRELDVLDSIAKGNSNKAVADSLHISEETVKGHVRNLLAKLQANDRTHAVMIGLKRGFIE
jgi:DNA-binding NarL/FixJ family response regulator